LFRALLIVVALIVYGCLYPFRFHAMPPDGWGLFWHSWPLSLNRFVARDALVNILLYIPVGMLTYLALGRLHSFRLRLLLPVLFACLLSTCIELVQLMDFPRNSSAFDVVCNIAGAAIGLAGGIVYSGRLIRLVARTDRVLAPTPGAPLLVFAFWLGYEAFPLFPSMGRFALRAKWNLFCTSPFSLAEAAAASVEWIAVAALLASILRRAVSLPWMLVLLALLPARLLLLGRNLTASELAGAALGCLLWTFWLASIRRPALALAILIVGALLVQGLSPYFFKPTPQAFSWIPLAGFIDSGPDWGALTFLKKGFWYGAAVWAFHEAGFSLFAAAVPLALLLAALEWAQRYLPGRTPEISDPLLVLGLALFFGLLEDFARPAPAHHAAADHSHSS
jgi:VanZ family protein